MERRGDRRQVLESHIERHLLDRREVRQELWDRLFGWGQEAEVLFVMGRGWLM